MPTGPLRDLRELTNAEYASGLLQALDAGARGEEVRIRVVLIIIYLYDPTISFTRRSKAGGTYQRISAWSGLWSWIGRLRIFWCRLLSAGIPVPSGSSTTVPC
jgi:hypothetical protein